MVNEEPVSQGGPLPFTGQSVKNPVLQLLLNLMFRIRHAASGISVMRPKVNRFFDSLRNYISPIKILVSLGLWVLIFRDLP